MKYYTGFDGERALNVPEVVERFTTAHIKCKAGCFGLTASGRSMHLSMTFDVDCTLMPTST